MLPTIHRIKYFYPRPPGGGRLRFSRADLPADKISIHALRVEGDAVPLVLTAVHVEFLSTPSGWRATRVYETVTTDREISIHALRVEGDIYTITRIHPPESISIHALRVEGDERGKICITVLDISIHALRVEGDLMSILQAMLR